MYKTKKIVLSFCLISVSLAVSAQNKKLHNGIVYPEQWPPRYEEPAVAQDMPVPYLKEKPAVIPVNLGRQLFVDNFLIAETDLQPIYHTPNFYPQNPVLEPDKEGRTQRKVHLMLLRSVTVFGMMRKTADLKCGIWQVRVVFINKTSRLSTPDMPSRKMENIG